MTRIFRSVFLAVALALAVAPAVSHAQVTTTVCPYAKEAAMKGELNLATNTVKAALYASDPTGGSMWNGTSGYRYYVATGELSTANGYTQGGATVGTLAITYSGATVKFSSAPIVWTASGGSIGPVRYMVLYSDTHVSKACLVAVDFGATQTATSGGTLTVTPNGTNGWLYF